jgi:hypothetical protein
MAAAWEAAPLVGGDAPAWQSAPIVGGDAFGSGAGLAGIGRRAPTSTAPAATPAPLPPVTPSPGLDREMPTLAGNLPSETPGVPGPSLTLDDVRKYLEPEPGMVYGSPAPEGHYLDPAYGGAPGQIAASMFSPFKRDPKTDTTSLTLPGAIRNPLLGLLDVAQGRYQTDDSGNPLSVRPTPNTIALTGAAASPLRMGPREPVPTSLAAREAPLSVEFQQNAMGPAATAKVLATPEGAPVSAAPAPPVAAPAPVADGGTQSVGAAASRDMTAPEVLTAKTPAQRIRDLESSANQTAEERAGPQMRDDTPYVADIPPRLLASRDFSQSVNALDEKVAKAKDPAFRDAVDKNNRDRNEGMVDLLRTDAGDAIALDKAHDVRSEVSPTAMGVFNGEKPVDGSGLVTTIDGLLRGPDGKRGAIRTVLNDVRASLFDADGNLETLPSQLYGARKNITDLLKKGVKGIGEQADNVRASKSILTGLLPHIDQTITSGAAPFADYLSKWSELSQPINRMEFLQKYQTGAKKITNDQGYLQPHKVQTMLDDILQAHKASGVNGGKALTDAEIQNVINVRNELAAGGLQDRLASVRGSDSFQQFSQPGVLGRGPIGGAVKGLGEAALGLSTAGVGNMIYHFGVKPGFEVARNARIAAQEAARKEQLLSAPPQNRLAPN